MTNKKPITTINKYIQWRAKKDDSRLTVGQAAYRGKRYYRRYRLLMKMSHNPEAEYTPIDLHKASGKIRRVYEPSRDLRTEQFYIIKLLEELGMNIHPAACAYRKGMNLLDAVRPHFEYLKLNPECTMVKLDIKSFFDSVTAAKVYDMLGESFGITGNLRPLLTNLLCLEGRTPQGSPASPAISNLVFYPLDDAFDGLVVSCGGVYTRYSDDMIFSFDESAMSAGDLIREVRRILGENGFRLNTEKTKVICPGRKREIMGIVIDGMNETMQVSAAKRREYRQIMHYINKYGVTDHLQHTMQPDEAGVPVEEWLQKKMENRYMLSLIGRMRYCLYINPGDKEIAGYIEQLENLICENCEKLWEIEMDDLKNYREQYSVPGMFYIYDDEYDEDEDDDLPF